jgi:hypothetical protein
VYDRDDELEKRTELMAKWAGYLGMTGLKLAASRVV